MLHKVLNNLYRSKPVIFRLFSNMIAVYQQYILVFYQMFVNLRSKI